MNSKNGWRGWNMRTLMNFVPNCNINFALALDLEDEEDERSRLFIKLSEGSAKTREQFFPPA